MFYYSLECDEVVIAATYISPGGPVIINGIPHVVFTGHCITFGMPVSVKLCVDMDGWN